MYINRIKINNLKITKKFSRAIGFLCMSIGTFLSVVPADDILNNNSNLESITALCGLFFLIIFGIVLIYNSKRLEKIIEDINFYSRYFEGDIDGYIYTSDMTKTIGKSEKEINDELNKLIRKRYMMNFILKQNPNSIQIILLSNKYKCECNNCGAIIDKRESFVGTCPYCGSSDIYAKTIEKKDI